SKLNLAPGGGGARQLPEARRSVAQRGVARARQEKRWRVGQIERFGAKLHISSFPDAEILEQREIEIRRARSTADAPGRVSEQRDRNAGHTADLARVFKRGRVEVAVYALVRQIDRFTGHTIGHADSGEELVAGSDPRAADIGREAATQG